MSPLHTMRVDPNALHRFKKVCIHRNTTTYRIKADKQRKWENVVVGGNNLSTVILVLSICDDCGYVKRDKDIDYIEHLKDLGKI